MAITSIKSPGVYIEEVSLFPPSVAEVATAIPAFIGYTEKAVSPDGKALSNVPTRVRSLKEYEFLFGKGFVPSTIAINLTGDKQVQAIPSKRFFLYESLRQYFDNGGAPCYIVSADFYAAANGTINDIAIGNDDSGLMKGLRQVEKYDEPTLLLFPDAMLAKDSDGKSDFVKIAELQKAALSQCMKLQDRFTVMDIADGDKAEDTINQPITEFRNKIGVNGLSYAAAYYPWVVSNYNYDLAYKQFDFSAINLANVSVNATEAKLLDAFLGSGNPDIGNGALKNTGLVIETLAQIESLAGASTEDIKSGVKADTVGFLSAQLAALKQAIVGGVANGDDVVALGPKNAAYFLLLNNIIHSFIELENALPPSILKTAIVNLKKQTALTNAIQEIIRLEQLDIVISRNGATFTLDIIKSFFDDMFDADAASNPWINLEDTSKIPAQAVVFSNNQDGVMEVISTIESNLLPVVLTALGGIAGLALENEESAAYYQVLAENALFTQHSFFIAVKEQALKTLRTIPASGALAGVYAIADGTRGVWKAPANVSLNAVIGPAVKIDNRDQDDLNVHTTGKSINAIRSFTGKGTLVWGARTLAGNDNEWRYIPVRRFFIMVEESVKKASQPFVFEPNDPKTWTKVKSMVENFLTLQWRAGALQGAKPADAFFVHIGLGETMSDDDVLNGRMIVEIGMAVVRPAEFIVLRFSHKMMER